MDRAPLVVLSAPQGSCVLRRSPFNGHTVLEIQNMAIKSVTISETLVHIHQRIPALDHQRRASR
jgi:hypothetical protein